MKKLKSIISLLLVVAFCFSLSITSYAEVIDGTYDVIAETIVGDKDTYVEYTRSDSYSLMIPKSIRMDGTVTNPTQDFTVTCKGDIASGSTISVTTDSNFNFIQEGKSPVACDVTYDHTFTFDEINTSSGKVTNGSIVVPTDNGNALSAGQWAGEFNFQINYRPFVEVPNVDEYTKLASIRQFIKDNKYTDLNVGLQGDGTGKFYVKAGTFTDGENPSMDEDGVLIYDMGAASLSSQDDNSVCAVNLGNIMNYILSKTKGSDYGSATPIITQPNKSFYPSNNRGIIMGMGISNGIVIAGQTYAGKYNSTQLFSFNSSALWW